MDTLLRLELFLNEAEVENNKSKENFFIKEVKKIFTSMDLTELKNFLQSKFLEFVATIDKAGLSNKVSSIIKKHFSHVTSLDMLKKKKLKDSEIGLTKESLDESFSSWVKDIKRSSYDALSFYPALQMYLELDKFIRNHKEIPDPTVLIVYAVLWVTIISAKNLIPSKKSKEETPSEE